MKQTYKNFLLWLISTKGYAYFMSKVVPKIVFREKKYSVAALRFQYELLIKTLAGAYTLSNCHGIVISTRDSSKLAGLVIPSDLDHSALIVGWDWEESDFLIIQAVGHGVEKVKLWDLIQTTEGFTAHIGIKWDLAYRGLMCYEAHKYIGKPYDYGFKFGVEALYCSELIYLADFEKRCLYDVQDLAGIGRDYISPKGISEGVGMLKLFDSEVNPYI